MVLSAWSPVPDPSVASGERTVQVSDWPGWMNPVAGRGQMLPSGQEFTLTVALLSEPSYGVSVTDCGWMPVGTSHTNTSLADSPGFTFDEDS